MAMARLRIFLRLFALILFLQINVCLAAGTATGTAGTTSTAAATTRPHKLPLRFLTFAQIARLEYTQRVKYFKQLRALFSESEKAQTLFRHPLFAANDRPDFNQQNEFYASIWGREANAETEQGRGRFPGDECIYAYQLSRFEGGGMGERRPFLCEIPTGASCVGANGPGVSCGELSGITPKMAKGRECIPNNLRHVSTSMCEKLRHQLTTENGPAIQEAIQNAQAHFKLNTLGAKITNTDLSADAARDILQALADHRYDDGALAQLVSVISLYKKNQVPLPIGTLGKEYAAIEPANLEKNINQAQANFSKIFEPYIAHCEAPLTAAEIKIISTPDSLSQAKQMGSKAGDLEAKRFAAYQKFQTGKDNQTISQNSAGSYVITDAGTGASRAVRIEDILEVEECLTIKKHLNSIGQRQESIISSYPEYSNGGPRPTPLTPPPPPAEEDNIKPIGCANVIDNDELYRPAARCMLCLAQRAVVKQARFNGDAAKIEKANAYIPSNKWLSLLSTMVLACGDGFSNGRDVHPKKMLDYMQTFGHCGQETYEWRTNFTWDENTKKWITNPNDPKADLQPQDRALIQKWATGSLWTNNPAGKIKKDDNNAFQRIYGVKYDTATKIFCNPERFKNGFFTRKIKEIKDSENTETPAAFMQRGRSQLTAAVKNSNIKSELTRANADALFSCMTESLDTANTLYSGGVADTCLSTAAYPANSQAPDLKFSAMVNDIENKGGAAITFDGGSCYVSKQLESRPGAPQYRNIGMTDPLAVNEYADDGILRVMSAYGGKNVIETPLRIFIPTKYRPPNANAPTLYTPQQRTTLEFESGFSFTYPDKGRCDPKQASSSSPRPTGRNAR